MLWTYAHVPYGYREAYPGEVAELIEKQIERFAPGFRDRIARRVITTPAQLEAWDAKDFAKALQIYQDLLPVYTGVFATQGVMMVKAGLAHQGFPVGGLRGPLVDAPTELAEEFGRLLDSTEL